MGFDNECIVNIQTLAGEYFCPVCRLLVYPNEAIQSQCTHLYCKPCLTYVVGTTRACPYDGYLVTEQDSKPLLESNKALADTIGKIPVRCLFYRSGCQWQGSLSDCSSHCSGCAFGNSPVVCNRCAIQIAHRQVQEHAQTCQGVQPQATQAIGTQSLAPAVAATPASGEKPQTATQSGTSNSVTKIPQTGAIPTTGQDPNLQASANPQVYGATPGAVPTPEQLYQQQYYQQYPGYDPYQQAYQNYYPYPPQPQVYAQPPQQVQAYSQPQPQQQQQPPAQSQTLVQSQALPQPQGQAQSQSLQNVNPQYQIPNATQPPAQMMPPAQPPSQGYPQPQSYPAGQPQQPVPPHAHSQPMQMPQFLQPQMQHHPPPHPQAHPQPQTQAHPHHQPMNQSLNPNVQPQAQQPLAHAVSGYNSYPQPQTQQQMQTGAQQRPNLHPQSGFTPQIPPHAQQGQYPPQRPQMGVPQSAAPNQQFPHQGQLAGVPSVQQPPANPYGQQPGHPAMQPMPQPMPQQHVFPGQASGPVQNQLHPRGQQMQFPPLLPSHPQLHPHQNYPARPVMPNLGAQSQPFAQSTAGYPGQAQARPPHLGPNQHPANQNHLLKTNNPLQKNEPLSQRTSEREVNGLATASGVGIESAEAKNLKAEKDAKLGVNEDANTGAKLHKEEIASAQPTSNGGKFHEAVGADPKDGADGFQHEKLKLGDKSKEGGTNMGAQLAPVAPAHVSGGSAKLEDKNFGQSYGQVLCWNPDFPMQYPPSHQQGPAGTMSQPVRPSGVPHHAHVPGQPPYMFRPQGPGQFPHSGQPFNLPPNHFQHPPYERPPSEFGGPRIPLGEPNGPFNSGGFIGRTPPYGTEGQVSQQCPIDPPGNENFPDPRSRYMDGQSPGSKSQVRNRKHVVGTDSSTGRAPRILDKEPFGGYGERHMDRFASRSPGRENAGFPPRNFEGRDSRPFDGGPRPFMFPSDPGFIRGSEFQGPRNLPGHLPFDTTTFGDFPGPARRGDLHAHENFPRHRPFGEEFGGNMSGHPNLGDHGFRSSYPSAGGLDPFGNSNKRMLSNNGWCRICKIDCEGVEGLELHSQTREHQEMAMDLVRSIKMRTSKRQKVSNDRSSFEEPSKRRGSGHEVHNN